MTAAQRPYVILAALQFDETGDAALREAVCIGQRASHLELHVVHVIAPSTAGAASRESTLLAAQMVRAPERFKEYVERACAGTSLEIRGHIRAGDPVEAILQTAADLDADVIVLGTHRRSGLEKLLLGSVAERVLHQAHSPVLVAMPKTYERQAEANAIEPPCPECVELRRATRDPSEWCERHSRARLRPHVYTPSDRPHASVFGT